MHTQQQLEAKLLEVLADVLSHGFGKFRVRVSLAREGKRTVQIDAGKCFQFTIPVSELRK